MIYALFILGLIIFIIGYKNYRSERKNFALLYNDALTNDEISVVNNTIDEIDMRRDFNDIKKKVNRLDEIINDASKRIDNIEETVFSNKNYFNQVFEQIKNSNSLDELSKETGIGKGEQLLLKNLLQK